MKKHFYGSLTRPVTAIFCAFILTMTAAGLTACGGSSVHGDGAQKMSSEDAQAELDALLTKVDQKTVKSPVMDIYSDEAKPADALASINTLSKHFNFIFLNIFLYCYR